jgi:signal transduction histidine kinase
MRWWLSLSFAIVAAVTAFAVAQVFQAQSRDALRSKAQDLAAGTAVGAAVPISEATTLRQIRAVTAAQAGARRVALFVFDSRGRIVSAPSSSGVELASIPELPDLVDGALAGRRTVASTDDGRRLTVALPIRAGPGAALVEVAHRPDLVAAATIVEDRIWIAAAWAVLVGATVGILVSLMITVRVRRIAVAAAAIADGRFETPVRSRFRDELGGLAEALDAMRVGLNASFRLLASDRDQLRTLVEQLQEGVIGVQADSTVVVANARASALLGAAVREDEPLRDPWPGVGLGGLAERLFAVDAKPSTMLVSPGAERIYAVTGIPASGARLAVLVVTDVTDRERRELAQREFVANAAHELRTPLAAVGSAVEVLQLGAKEDAAERDRFLSLIERQTKRLIRLVEALLTLARAQSRAETVELAPLGLQDLLHEIASDGGLPRSAVHVDPSGLAALAHRELLRQAIENLIGNAVKYAGEAGLTVSARSVGGDRVAVEVRDRGPGLGHADTDRMLERFYRNGRHDPGGFGLGLSIVREVARAFGGHVEIESRPGGGIVARLLLRRAEGTHASPPRSRGTGTARGAGSVS